MRIRTLGDRDAGGSAPEAARERHIVPREHGVRPPCSDEVKGRADVLDRLCLDPILRNRSGGCCGGHGPRGREWTYLKRATGGAIPSAAATHEKRHGKKKQNRDIHPGHLGLGDLELCAAVGTLAQCTTHRQLRRAVWADLLTHRREQARDDIDITLFAMLSPRRALSHQPLKCVRGDIHGDAILCPQLRYGNLTTESPCQLHRARSECIVADRGQTAQAAQAPDE